MTASLEGFAVDSALVGLFLSDARQHAAALAAGLEKLAEGCADTLLLLPELESAAQAIKGAARIAGCEPAALMANHVEQLLHDAADLEPPLSNELAQSARASVELLSRIGELDPTSLGPWLEARQQEIRATLKRRAGARHPPTIERAAVPGAAAIAPAVSMAPAVDATILALFRTEAESCTATLSRGLVQLESGGQEVLEELMRAAHSFKGAARIVGIASATQVAHALEDCFVAAQEARLELGPRDIDVLLGATDMLTELARCSAEELGAWQAQRGAAAASLVKELEALARGERPGPLLGVSEALSIRPAPSARLASVSSSDALQAAEVEPRRQAEPALLVREGGSDRVVRVAAKSINRLLGLAGESLVESRRVQSLSNSMKRLKRRQAELGDLLEALGSAAESSDSSRCRALLVETKAKALECKTLLTEELSELEAYERRVDDLSERLYREAQKSRMRPFGDCVHGFPRMVRDVARKLGKLAKFSIFGESTDVDRDVLESLDAPLNHLLRNALDHGVEATAERVRLGKPPEAQIRLEARHHAGMLAITVSDDGRGIDPEALRKRIVDKGLLNASVAAGLTGPELMEFIFLPGFSTASTVTEISGRGVGLDVVRTAIHAASGTVRVTSELGRGTRFHLELPVTRSVLRAMVVEIDGEAYAFPLLRIERILRMPASELCVLGNSQFFVLRGENVALVSARQILGFGSQVPSPAELSIVVLGSTTHRYGIAVDKFLGEHDLVVRPLDARLGKVSDIAAAAILLDGSPALIFDTDDLVRSIEKLAHNGRIDHVSTGSGDERRRKRILVVDDSITVREAERQLLVNHGYVVDVAVDGVDGWNTLRGADYDLIVSDIDMPRMNGLELVRTIKRDAKLSSIPVIIVSYKDRQEDRLRGMDAGANRYLTKSSFHDESLIEAVDDLIGSAHA
jgi:two-component system sensor histidine kinase and response regulator WspE